MSSIPKGNWLIESVIVNDETVLNHDGVRSIQIQHDEWIIQPNGQRFRIRQSTANSSVLESEGSVYYADYKVVGGVLQLQLNRPNFKETLDIEAVALTADVFIDRDSNYETTASIMTEN